MSAPAYAVTVLIERAGCVGREQELAEVLERLEATRVGGADALVVLGDSGMGKSALLRALAQRVPSGTQVRTAHAAAWESSTPGAVLRQLVPDLAGTEPGDDAADRLLASATDAPALLLLDDADRADERSLQALVSGVRRHRTAPLLVVLTARSTTPLLRELAADSVRMEGLDAAAMAQLAGLRGRVLHPAMADELARHTGGNPRDALALLDELPPAVWSRPGTPLPAPAHVVAEVETALATCGRLGRDLVEALAVLGDRPLGDAARLAGLEDVEAALSALDEARAVGLVTLGTGGDARLRSGLVRAAVLGAMGAGHASAAHRRAAGLVSDHVQRLRHLVAATPLPDADLAGEVARAAEARGGDGAWAEAAELYRGASRLTPDPLQRDERLLRSVDAMVAAGDCVGAAALAPVVESMRETPLRNAVLAYLAIVRGRAAEADVRLERAWDIVNAEREPDVAALIAQRYVLHALGRCRGEELVAWADRAAALAGPESAAGLEAAAIRGLGHAMAGDTDRARVAYETASELVAHHGAQAQRVAMGCGWLDVLTDRLDDARRRLEGATGGELVGGSARITLWGLGWLARVHLLVGDWDEALRTVAEGRALASRTGIVLASPLLEWTAVQVHLAHGDADAAAAAARAAERGVQGYAIMQVPALLARAQVAEDASDHARVRSLLEPLTRARGGTALAEPAWWPWADTLATALVVRGRLEEAETVLAPAEERAERGGQRGARARLGHARGRLLAARGDIAAASRAFEESLELLDGLPLRYDRARLAFAHGQALRRAGRRREADAVLSTARDLWAGLGAHAYADRCDRELRASGSRVARDVRDPEALTPQEETVAELVASGLANREVASRLFVSPKTVQYHLTRIYTKLGVRTRTELAARFAERPQAQPIQEDDA